MGQPPPPLKKGHSYNPAHLMSRLPPSEAAVEKISYPDLQVTRWNNKRVAHIFDDKWHDGAFKRKLYTRADLETVRWLFYYNDDKVDYGHTLLVEEYGMTKSWVVIEKTPA
jgi:hypothetical protein